MNKLSAISPRSELTEIWPAYKPTELVELPAIARLAGVGRLFAKAEWQRPLGNFKSLGGMIAGLRALARVAGVASIRELIDASNPLQPLPRLICASDGNHGLAVAAAAHRVDGRATVYLPSSVGRSRAARIQAMGGDIVWVDGTYDDAVSLAAFAAARGDGLLVPDTTDDRDNEAVRDVMAGYAVMTDEIVAQFADISCGRPSHLFIQAGVGGLAAAMAEGLQDLMQAPKQVLVVEPEAAACVGHAISEGTPMRIVGDLHTSAGMLSCGVASAPAVEILHRYGAHGVVVSEEQLQQAVIALRESASIHTTPSGAAGLAGFLQVAAQPALRDQYGLAAQSNVLLVITEGLIADELTPHMASAGTAEPGRDG